MDHFIDSKIPNLGIFVDKNSQNDQTPFPKVGRKTPGLCSIFIDIFFKIAINKTGLLCISFFLTYMKHAFWIILPSHSFGHSHEFVNFSMTSFTTYPRKCMCPNLLTNELTSRIIQNKRKLVLLWQNITILCAFELLVLDMS